MLRAASRGIRLVNQASNDEQKTWDCLFRKVLAGYPILAQENMLSRQQYQQAMFSQKQTIFSLFWNKHENIGIMEGDLLAVHKTTTVQKWPKFVRCFE